MKRQENWKKYITRSFNVYMMIRLRRMEWMEHVTSMRDMRYAYKILVGKPGWLRPLDGPRFR
jgi:hypothetical protein